jgi:lipopolysaccharide biosynthesis glycosyltransferase
VQTDGVHEHHHDEIAVKGKYEFDNKTKALIQEFVTSIAGVQMYNSGKILVELEKLRKKATEDKLLVWADELESCVFNYDEDTYTKLLSENMPSN